MDPADMYALNEASAQEPAGLGEDPVDKVVKPIVKEVEHKAAEWLAHLACGIDSENSAAVLDTIKQVSGLMGDILVALDPGVKKFDGQFGTMESYGANIMQPIGGPTNTETFGAQMMTQLTEALKMQYGPKPIKHDVGKLMTAINQAKRLGHDDAAEKLQKKLDEVLDSDDYAVAQEEMPILELPPGLPGAVDEVASGEEEKEDAE